MLRDVAAAVLVVVLVGVLILKVRAAILACWFLVMAGRWLSGKALSGEAITNAGLFRRGEGRALTKTGHAHSWWYRPRWQRAMHRTGATLLVVLITWGLLADFWLTVALILASLSGALAAAGWWAWVWVTRRRLERRWYLPLHLAAHELAGHPRAIPARSWITVDMEVDGSVRQVRMSLPQNWHADPKEEQRLVAITAARAGIEAPEASWRRPGPAPEVIIRHGEEAPPFIEYGKGRLGEQLAEAVMRAGRDEIVSGLGKPVNGKYPAVSASLKLDSPHFMVNMGSGGGKSELTAFWMMQELRRGAVVMVLDNKWHSQAWMFKDEHAEFSYLPNVAYLSSPEQIHAGLVWAGGELDRRNRVTTRGVDAHGRMHGDAGPRFWIVCEEMNFVTPKLRDHWTEIREKGGPKKSPALTALAGLSFAGRAVDMHLVVIGQMLTADATGSRDSSVKANIGVKAMSRYDLPGWSTAVGKNVPMPPPSEVLGRIQLVTAGKAREAQAPKADYLLYRELALSGIMTPCPAGMPRIGGVPAMPSLSPDAPEQLVVPGTPPPLGQFDVEPVTLDEAAGGIVNRSKVALRKQAQRDPDFPPRIGVRGQAYLYDPRELAEWDAGRR